MKKKILVVEDNEIERQSMIELLGYSKGPDGFYRDRTGQTLQVQARTSQGDDLQEKTMYAAADDWQKVGVQVEPA